MILSVANQKGGVAKTTSTLAIASNLKKKGYKALVIDMDPHVVRQIKSTTIRHFILTGIAEKRSNKAYYKHLIRQIK